MIKKAILTLILASICVLSVSAEGGKTVSKTEIFTAKTADATYSFPTETEIDGVTYEQIGETVYRVVSSTPITKEEEKQYTVESEPMLRKEMSPAQTVTVEGLTYTLASVTYKDTRITNRTMSLTSYTEWKDHIGEPAAPKSKTKTYHDADAGISDSAELPFIELIATTPTEWRAADAQRITFSIVNASLFKLGDKWVEYNPALPNLEEYETELISLMGFETGTYRVIRSAWAGDEYEKDGKKCRDALVYGEKYCATYRATYGKTINLTDVAGYIGVANYTATATIPTDETEYTIEATATYQPIADFPIVPVVSVGGATVVALFFAGWLLTHRPVKLYDAQTGKRIGSASIRGDKVKLPSRSKKYGAVIYEIRRGAFQKRRGQTLRFYLGADERSRITVENPRGRIDMQ